VGASGTSHRPAVIAFVAAVMMPLATPVVAADPTTGPSPTSASSPVPSAPTTPTPFPWPTLAPPAPEPALEPLEPTGPPDATATRHGVRVDLWLSSLTVAQGEWVQALVRVTNTRDDPVWTPGGDCWLTTTVGVDLSPLYPQEATLSGNAAAFMRRVVRERGLLSAGFGHWTPEPLPDASGVPAVALADCAPELGARFLRIGPGRSRELRYAWYPMARQDALDTWMRPLPPGPVSVTASWQYAGHGARPTGPLFRRHPDLISAKADLELTGTDPGFPTPIEIVEAALADPAFAAWVAADPTRADWAGTYFGGWPGPDYPAQSRFAGLAGRAPDGIAEVWLVRDLPGSADAIGAALVDPWTGAVLGFATQCGDQACPAG
jgi:hypothetical protein